MVDVQVDQFGHHVTPAPAVLVRYHVPYVLGDVVVDFLALHLRVHSVAPRSVVPVALPAHSVEFAVGRLDHQVGQLLLLALSVDPSGNYLA